MNTISTYEHKIDQKDSNNSVFWKNKIIDYIEKEKKSITNRNLTPEKEEEIISDLWKNIINLSKQAKSRCIHEKNKRKMGFDGKQVPEDIQKEIIYFKRLEEKWRRVEQNCIRGIKKRSIKKLINGNLFKTLINQPENNRFQYTTKTSKTIYDVIVLEKETTNDKTTYQLETTEGKPFKFAVTIDKNQEDKYFQTSKNTLIIEGLEEIEKVTKDLLSKIPG
ncbi:MAG: hypothetical protein PHR61_02965 [Candidatus Absconditabacteria bacterium]|nr:hypothetical protein [Candidatus Absconditabacteria bacterium]